MYALNLAETGRVLSATYPQYAPPNAVRVQALPEGNLYEYRWVNDTFLHDPLPTEPITQQPSADDRRDAQLTYTAMMTDTLLPGAEESEETANV